MAEAQLIEVYPVEASASGKNSHYHFCHIRGAQQNYAVCLHILKARDEDRIRADDFVDCQRACLRGDCNAIKMREEERAAGQALFYKPRVNVNPANVRSEEEAQRNALVVRNPSHNMSNASYARGWSMAGGDKPQPAAQSPKPTLKPAPKPKRKSGFVEESYADVVNAIATEAPVAKPTPTAKPTEALKPLPGETPLQFAKRRAQAMKESK